MVIEPGGNVGIGTENPQENLVVGNDIGDYGGTRITIGNSSDVSGLNMGENSTNRMFMLWDDDLDLLTMGTRVGGVTYPRTLNLVSGQIGIGIDTPTAQLHTNGSVRLANFGSGTLITDSNGNVSASSDERLKHIKGKFEAGLEAILNIEPIAYSWREESGNETKGEYYGFSAQNVQAALPGAVGSGPDGYLTLSDRPILAAMVNTIEELHQINNAQSALIQSQQEALQQLESRLAALESNQEKSTDAGPEGDNR